MQALVDTNALPIKHQGNVHSGKVRSVYWLTDEDSARLGEEFGVTGNLGVMVTSDRISAFDCNWQAENLQGVPGKGAALNAISEHWFKELDYLAGNHLVDALHPNVWLVQRAEPILVEGVARGYITGSMWRAYEKGDRVFSGVSLPDGLQDKQRLEDVLFTPSTKGTLKGLKGIPEAEDTPISISQINKNWKALGYKGKADVGDMRDLVVLAFGKVSQGLADAGYTFVDTKFEIGYIDGAMAFIDEVGTPDSSRYWPAGSTIPLSKESFRAHLLSTVDRGLLLNPARYAERKEFAAAHRVTTEEFERISGLYGSMVQVITGTNLVVPVNAREEVMDTLSGYELVK